MKRRGTTYSGDYELHSGLARDVSSACSLSIGRLDKSNEQPSNHSHRRRVVLHVYHLYSQSASVAGIPHVDASPQDKVDCRAFLSLPPKW